MHKSERVLFKRRDLPPGEVHLPLTIRLVLTNSFNNSRLFAYFTRFPSYVMFKCALLQQIDSSYHAYRTLFVKLTLPMSEGVVLLATILKTHVAHA